MEIIIYQCKKSLVMSSKAKKTFSITDEKRQKLPRKVPNGVYEISYIGDRFISVDDYICDSLGFSRDELLSLNPLELLDDKSRECICRVIAK